MPRVQSGGGGGAGRCALSAAILVLGMALSGCSLSRNPLQGDSLATGSLGDASIKETALAGQRWRADPANARLGVDYAKQLEQLKQHEEQLKVLNEVARRNPGDAELQSYYGKQLAIYGRGAEAEQPLRAVVDQGKADWRVLSALGSALDQQGRYADARQQYQRALQLKPNDLSILNNLGMSYMLEGNLARAESTFRNASTLPGGASHPRLRQNLALSVGLQGRFDEAREIASRDLPPVEVEANMAYLKSMLSQPNTWKQLQGEKPQA